MTAAKPRKAQPAHNNGVCPLPLYMHSSVRWLLSPFLSHVTCTITIHRLTLIRIFTCKSFFFFFFLPWSGWLQQWGRGWSIRDHRGCKWLSGQFQLYFRVLCLNGLGRDLHASQPLLQGWYIKRDSVIDERWRWEIYFFPQRWEETIAELLGGKVA